MTPDEKARAEAWVAYKATGAVRHHGRAKSHFLAGWEARGEITEEMVEAMATAFAQSIHGEDADQQDADYYAEHLRAALGGEGR